MVEHVDEKRHTMFRDATDTVKAQLDTVKAQLDTMCRTVQKQLSEKVEQIFDVVFREYMNVIGKQPLEYRHALLIYLLICL